MCQASATVALVCPGHYCFSHGLRMGRSAILVTQLLRETGS